MTTAPFSNTTTSRDAADKLVATLKGKTATVHRALARPDTAEGIVRRTGLSMQTVSARIRDLVLKGLAEDSGARGTTLAGNPAIIWRQCRKQPIARSSPMTGRTAHAVLAERRRILKLFSDRADKIMQEAGHIEYGATVKLVGRTGLEQVSQFAVEQMKAHAIRDAVIEVAAALAK